MIVIKIIISLIFLLLNYINLILGAPILTTIISPRWGHTATLVGTKIYFIGGRTLGNVLATEFLSLDVSRSFTSLQPEWLLLDTIGVPKTIEHTAVIGGSNNEEIIIFGGGVDDPATALTNSLYIYDTVNNVFTNPNLPNGPSRRYDHSAVTTPTGNMLIYGGYVDQWTGSPTASMTSELWELNTINLNFWNGFSLINNSPGLRRSHTASIVDNKMYILGGVVGNTPLGMNVIYAFDLINNIWEINTATGEIPLPRREFTSVVANKKIIIYGGTDVTRSILYGDVAVLDTDSWTWSKQETANPPPNRSGHTATLVGANMIVAFGSIGSSMIDSSIYILNILDWSWDTQYVPTDLPSDDSYTTMKNITNPNINRKNNFENSDTTRIYLIVIIVLAVVCGILFFIIIWYIIYRQIDKHKIATGQHLLGIPYEFNEPPTAQQQQRIKPRPSFLCLGKNKRDRHKSTQSAQGLVNSSIPTSPSTVPSTPHTMTMNNRYSNNSAPFRYSLGSGVGGLGLERYSTGSGVGRVTFNDRTETIQYSPESESSNASPFDNFDDDSETVQRRNRLRVETNIKPKGSVDDISYQFGPLYVINPDKNEDDEDEEDDKDEEEGEEEEEEEGEEEEESEENEEEEDDDDDYYEEGEEEDDDEEGNNNDDNGGGGDDDDDDDDDDEDEDDDGE
ncbi:hypothetical protein RclHR1_17540006 [Rhizophagus clarus]|uniref:Galactose oxidase n=1 Tax=Rhizophagus clarus TaxID=94130 RepID=A0A2Z6QK94_9GLOM|nr:hypothetical protein RclHR1_17540006 [Rhizophagus clarus]GES77778.1 galactose oxidase [Rhizophagus clarus]